MSRIGPAQRLLQHRGGSAVASLLLWWTVTRSVCQLAATAEVPQGMLGLGTAWGATWLAAARDVRQDGVKKNVESGQE